MTDGDFTGGYVDDEGYPVAPSEYAEQDTPQGYSDYDGTEYADKHDDGEQYVPESYEEIAERVAALEDAQAAEDDGWADAQDAHEAEWERQRVQLARDLGRPLLDREWNAIGEYVMQDVARGEAVDIAWAAQRHFNEAGRLDDPANGRSGEDAYWAERAQDTAGESGPPTEAELEQLVAKLDSPNDLVRNQAEAEIMALRMRGLVDVEW